MTKGLSLKRRESRFPPGSKKLDTFTLYTTLFFNLALFDVYTSRLYEQINAKSFYLRFLTFLASQNTKNSKNLTVEPLLNGHPPLNGHTSKSQNIGNTITIKYLSIKRPPALSGRGHQ